MKKTLKKKIFLECGCCGQWHPSEFVGDCRDDSNRFAWFDLPNDCKTIPLEEQVEE